jgi:hypothetical protein
VTAIPAKDNYWLLRIGAGAGVLGAVLAGVGNLLHPITPRDDPPGVARVIADSDYWTLIHLVIVIGIILMPMGLLAIRHSIAGNGFTDALTRLGMYAATIGATVGVITVILDGVAAKQLADQWAAAPAPAKAVSAWSRPTRRSTSPSVVCSTSPSQASHTCSSVLPWSVPAPTGDGSDG